MSRGRQGQKSGRGVGQRAQAHRGHRVQGNNGAQGNKEARDLKTDSQTDTQNRKDQVKDKVQAKRTRKGASVPSSEPRGMTIARYFSQATWCPPNAWSIPRASR